MTERVEGEKQLLIAEEALLPPSAIRDAQMLIQVTRPLKPRKVSCGGPDDAPWGSPLPCPAPDYSMT